LKGVIMFTIELSVWQVFWIGFGSGIMSVALAFVVFGVYTAIKKK